MKWKFSQGKLPPKRVLGGIALAMAALATAWFMAEDADTNRAAIGGDVALSRTDAPFSMAENAHLLFHGAARMSRIIEFDAVAKSRGKTGKSIQVRLKGIDNHYPLYGKLILKEQRGRKIFFTHRRKNLHGAAVDQEVLDALGLKPGEIFRIGKAWFTAQAVIVKEPDRGEIAHPRVMMNLTALKATRLLGTAGPVLYQTRVMLPKDADLEEWRRQLKTTFPHAGWSIRDWREGYE